MTGSGIRPRQRHDDARLSIALEGTGYDQDVAVAGGAGDLDLIANLVYAMSSDIARFGFK